MQYSDYLKLQVGKYCSHESLNAHWKEGQERFIRKWCADFPRTWQILDIACGDGVGLTCFKEMGFSAVTGVDYSEEKIEIAKTAGCSVVRRDFHDLSCFAHETFDMVYSSHSLEHAFDPVLVVREFCRILKVKGKLLLVLPFPDVGPSDAHTAKLVLGTASDDRGLRIQTFISGLGFRPVRMEFDRFREPEIWLLFEKCC